MRWGSPLSRAVLWRLRLTVHERPAQVAPVTAGIPWLGFVVYPDRRRLKARKAVHGTRQLTARYQAWRAGEISFAEFEASVQGWVNHVRHAHTWGLREHVLQSLSWNPEEAVAATEKNRRRAARGSSGQRSSGQ